MLVIALIVVASMQSTNTEMRISSNDADRKYAFSLAEQALRNGEQRIVTEQNKAFTAVANSVEHFLCFNLFPLFVVIKKLYFCKKVV